MTVNETRISIAERRRRVCIIGAGAGGLISCKELIDQGLEVVVYEAAECVGGTWVLRDQDGGTSTSYSSTGYGNRGLDVNQHSSMYDALHTNLPKDLMNIPGFTMGDDHTERYPHRTVVRDYLQDYCDVCGLAAHIQFNTTVTRAEYMGSSVACKDAEIHKLYYCDRQWSVHLLTNVDGVIEERVERFDAIVSANGHYSQPRLPTGSLGQQLKSHYTGSVIHSHRYRRPNGYEGKDIAFQPTTTQCSLHHNGD
ncbi:hypothetical protein SARC_10368 [Sphaeroforma arctica JP610]|uniref:Flavin-containing monooxygenase n=1 Tax=Sphaeroforma arctica JP610 TaxID=667725 RepID=A0A0L0FK69_9EUKA|nr:hypothetical protein SARC_10368 [Sphaeroforma arctica JP610]KNC77164.1 hypothetical protein SARC_10368 [Sphaeroforma arctica JP610]|eukprot:XP_014151066.1 hypothetical protein SARC_10368 [Sphaeroforma arctica JP610]